MRCRLCGERIHHCSSKKICRACVSTAPGARRCHQCRKDAPTIETVARRLVTQGAECGLVRGDVSLGSLCEAYFLAEDGEALVPIIERLMRARSMLPPKMPPNQAVHW